MNRTNNTNFSSDYLVGNLRDRSSPKTELSALGISKEEIDDICVSKSTRNRAHGIVDLAKKTLLKEIQQDSCKPLLLGERVAQITAHVYRWTFLSNSSRQELTDALNTEIHKQSNELSDTLATFSSSLEHHQQAIGHVIQQSASKIEEYEKKIETHASSSSLFKEKKIQELQEKVIQERGLLEAAVHTQNIFHRTIGKKRPHRIRTRPTSQFHVTLEPKPGNIGTEYRGLGIAFSPIKPQNSSQKPMFISCSPLQNPSQSSKPNRFLKDRTQVPVEIEIGNGKTKWAIINVPSMYLPQMVLDWLSSTEGKEALEQAQKSDWSLKDQVDELKYRYVPTSEEIEKRHLLFGWSAYTSSEEIVPGRETIFNQKFNRVLGEGGRNIAYKATAYHFSNQHSSITPVVIRKSQDKKDDTKERIEHKRRLYTQLEGCRHVAVPRLRPYHTLRTGKEKLREEMPVYNEGSLDQMKFKSEKEKLSICLQIITGVEEMHSRGVWHGDLKPQNIFLHRPPGEELQAFISDIDDAVFFGEAGLIATDIFLSPEYKRIDGLEIQNIPSIDNAIARDSYALGLSLYEATQSTLDPYSYYPTELEKATKAAKKPTASLQEKLNFIIIQLLNPDPATRMNVSKAKEALETLTI